MPEVVVLNGPPGVGKSTVTAVLRTLLPGTVAISGDELRAFAPPDARAHLGGGATYRAAGALAAKFLDLGAERVIFDYVFLRAAHFGYFREALPAAALVQVFTLWAPLEVVESRAGDRRADRRDGGLAVRDCYRNVAKYRPNGPHLRQRGRLARARRAPRSRAPDERCTTLGSVL